MMTPPTILITRTLIYVDKDGETKQVSMDLLLHTEEDGFLKVGVRFGPPNSWERYHPGDDVLHQIVYILAIWWIRLYIGGMSLAGKFAGSTAPSARASIATCRRLEKGQTPGPLPKSLRSKRTLVVLRSFPARPCLFPMKRALNRHSHSLSSCPNTGRRKPMDMRIRLRRQRYRAHPLW